MRAIENFIAGKTAPATGGRVGVVYNPNTGAQQAEVAFSTAKTVDAAVQAALKAQPGWAAMNPQRRARVMFEFKALVEKNMDELAHMLSSRARQGDRRRARRRAARPRSDRVRLRHPACSEGRIHRRRGAGHRRLFDAPAARRRRRHHAVQFPGDDPDVDVRRRHRLRQYLHPEAEREGPVRAGAPGGADDGSGRAGRRA